MGKTRKRSRSRSREHVSRKDLLRRLEKLEKSHSCRSRSPRPCASRSQRSLSRHRQGSTGTRHSSSELERRREPLRDENRRGRRCVDRSPSGSAITPYRSRSPASRSNTARSLYDAATRIENADRNPSGAASIVNTVTSNERDANTPPLQLHNDVELPEEVLNILGEDPRKKGTETYTLHQELTTRWSAILATGLSKEKSDELLNKYLPPENCKCLIPPLVNKEILPCIPVPYTKRDACHVNFQNQLGKGLSALGKGINALLEEGHDLSPNLRERTLPFLSEAGQILSNLFFNISQTRRTLITPMLSKSLKDVVETGVPDEYLFGHELGEKIKEAKMLERAAKDLRPPPQNAKSSFAVSKRGGGVTSNRQQVTKPYNEVYRNPKYGVPLNQRRPARQRRETRPRRGQSPRARNQQRR